MLRLLVLMLVSTSLAGQVFADTPDSVKIRARKGNITFTHKKHEEVGVLKECNACHSKEGGFKLGKQGMESGHTMCRKCHADLDAGPRSCDDCHK